MKSIRTAVVIILMMQMFGLVAGVNSLALITIYIMTLVGSILQSIIEVTWDEYVRSIVKERK